MHERGHQALHARTHCAHAPRTFPRVRSHARAQEEEHGQLQGPQDQPQHHAYPDQNYFARYQAFSGQQPNFDSSHAAARSTRVGSGLCASGGTSSTSAAGCDWSFPTAGPVSGEILNPNTLSLTTSGRVVPTLSCMEDSNIQQRKACGERQDNLYYPLHRVDQQAPSDCWQFD